MTSSSHMVALVYPPRTWLHELHTHSGRIERTSTATNREIPGSDEANNTFTKATPANLLISLGKLLQSGVLTDRLTIAYSIYDSPWSGEVWRRPTESNKDLKQVGMSEGVSRHTMDVGSSKMMRRLVSTRLEDIRDGFEEELQETKPMEKPFHRKRSTDSEDEDDAFSEIPAKIPNLMYENKGAALLAKMGYGGGGLGKSGQGRTELIPFSTQRGREGLGQHTNQKIARDWNAVWDFTEEEKPVEENVLWLSAPVNIREKFARELQEQDDWIIIGDRKETLDDETKYCDGSIVKKMLDAKSVFDQLDVRDLREARTRANPYETVGSVFFQNRAAMKMANLDRIYDWLLTGEKPENIEIKNPITVEIKSENCRVATPGKNTDRSSALFYFADICAGPGGFTEYTLWRKGKDDFKLKRFTAASPSYFEPYYGKHNDGDIMKPDNITSFEEVVKRGTCNVGADLVMADGGFCVDQQENIQEILSKRLYLCQFLIGISVLRVKTRNAESGGKFVCKLFDIFTPFSIGLIYLMYIVFERISIHKPNTSRPANSERYIVCDNPLECYVSEVKKYMTKINNELDRLSKTKTRDIVEVVPEKMIQLDKNFMAYVLQHNERTAQRQISYLNKYRIFAQNTGQLDHDQEKLRNECLNYWKIPDVTKKISYETNESLYAAISRLVKIIDFKELQQKPPAFTKSILSSAAGRMRYAELRMCAITEKEVPVLLISTQMGPYFYSSYCQQGFERVPFDVNIPKDTVLLVQITKAFKGLDDKGKLEGERAVIRILDAAMLSGDDVSALPFDERMAAVEKMCKAIKTVVSDKKVAPVLPAKVFKLDELHSEMERFHVILTKGEEVAVIEEGEEILPSFFYCRGMRIISLLMNPWIMCWSKGQEKLYAFNPTSQGSSVFSEQFEKAQCCVNFWKAVITKKFPVGSSDVSKTDCYQWFWEWTQSFIVGENYGPRAVLEAEDHPGGLTLRSVHIIAQQQKDSICQKHSL
uniref:Cap-specific mRNA (nucleoside-2'-O-)-methyltransferase 1 n=1 Tax=Setaria digitata TaxID=48799 RepID=A0A915PVM5_9BILA